MTFRSAPVPENEKNRLKAVYNAGILDVVNEELYAIYCHLSRKISKCPESWANVIDKDRQFNFVLDAENVDDDDKKELRELPREVTFCQYALKSSEPLIENDLTKSSIFRNHPSVLEPKGPRFYAAFPLVNSEGYILGTLCVRDYRVRRLSKEAVDLLKSLAKKLSHQLDIQAQQRNTSAEKVLQIIERLNSEFEHISLADAVIIMRCFSSSYISKKEKDRLRDLKLMDKNYHFSKKARELQNELRLDAAIVKRLKMPSLESTKLDNLFNQLS